MITLPLRWGELIRLCDGFGVPLFEEWQIIHNNMKGYQRLRRSVKMTVAGILGAIVGGLLGSNIGIAGGFGAINGARPLAVGVGVLCALVVALLTRPQD